MKKVYDNGYQLLGMQKYLIRYLKSASTTSDMEEEIFDMIKDLEDYEETDMIYINYDFGMGYQIESFEERDIVKEYE